MCNLGRGDCSSKETSQWSNEIQWHTKNRGAIKASKQCLCKGLGDTGFTAHVWNEEKRMGLASARKQMSFSWVPPCIRKGSLGVNWNVSFLPFMRVLTPPYMSLPACKNRLTYMSVWQDSLTCGHINNLCIPWTNRWMQALLSYIMSPLKGLKNLHLAKHSLRLALFLVHKESALHHSSHLELHTLIAYLCTNVKWNVSLTHSYLPHNSLIST